MEEDPSGAAHLVKPVHIVGQQVDYLACGGLPHGWATQAKGLKWERDLPTFTSIDFFKQQAASQTLFHNNSGKWEHAEYLRVEND